MNSFSWQAVVERLGWTLVHSVWRLNLVAVVAAGLEQVLRRWSAKARYGMLLAMLAVVIVSPAATAVLLTEAPNARSWPVITMEMQETVDSRGEIGLDPVLPTIERSPTMRHGLLARSVEPHSW